MNKIIADLIGFGKQYLRSTIGTFFAIVFPILLILIFGAMFIGGESSKINLPVQNLDDGPYSTALLDILNNTNLTVVELVPDSENISDYIKDNSLIVALVIPENFTVDLIQMQMTNSTGSLNLTLHGDPSKSSFGTAYSAVKAASDALNYYITDTKPYTSVSVVQIGSESFNYMDFFLPGIIGITVMTNALYSMTSTCAEYKTRSYFKLLATTNLRKFEWLISKFIFYTMLLCLSLVLTYLVGKLAFDMQSVLTPMAFVFIAVGAFVFTSMGMTLGIIVKDPESSVAIANAIGFPMMFLSGSFFPIESMPDYLQYVAQIMPLTYVNNGLRDTMVYGNEMSAFANLMISLAVGIVFFILASKLMSWKEK